ncbi:hypothetical protein QBC35DRAFT_458187 [Podospora australis]|uniref:HTH CENPB-type domain-containing protein n=1 Tax=Podospora australis TaxID=1536484 RepID=A0AAN7AM90_9PEZI|nr:hypothetical protein QBC35DRAFT_458187 [Podospora australis]
MDNLSEEKKVSILVALTQGKSTRKTTKECGVKRKAVDEIRELIQKTASLYGLRKETVLARFDPDEESDEEPDEEPHEEPPVSPPANGNTGRLTAVQRSDLAAWILQPGNYPTHVQIRKRVEGILRAQGDHARLGKKWVGRFLRRETEAGERVAQSVARDRKLRRQV